MLFSPGKKVRSAMVLWCCEIVSGQVNPSAMIGAAAIEMVHTYSLIHDDLPAMDDDDLRRGQPSCHKQFDEATAILAGDGLLTLAFEILSTQVEDSCAALKMVRTLSQAAGPSGMVAGQMDDLMAEHLPGTMELLRQIHMNKTARSLRRRRGWGRLPAMPVKHSLGRYWNTD
jgi:geranylgeranyl diphosphate synthase type II